MADKKNSIQIKCKVDVVEGRELCALFSHVFKSTKGETQVRFLNHFNLQNEYLIERK